MELPKIFSLRTTDDWTNLFVRFDIPGGEVLTLDPIFQKNDRLTEVNHPELGAIKLISSPYLNPKISHDYQVAPSLGEHTREILEEIGMNEDIERFMKKGVIGTNDSE